MLVNIIWIMGTREQAGVLNTVITDPLLCAELQTLLQLLHVPEAGGNI